MIIKKTRLRVRPEAVIFISYVPFRISLCNYSRKNDCCFLRRHVLSEIPCRIEYIHTYLSCVFYNSASLVQSATPALPLICATPPLGVGCVQCASSRIPSVLVFGCADFRGLLRLCRSNFQYYCLTCLRQCGGHDTPLAPDHYGIPILPGAAAFLYAENNTRTDRKPLR